MPLDFEMMPILMGEEPGGVWVPGPGVRVRVGGLSGEGLSSGELEVGA